jgi:hypothetical protein
MGHDLIENVSPWDIQIRLKLARSQIELRRQVHGEVSFHTGFGLSDNQPHYASMEGVHTILDSRLAKFSFRCPRSLLGMIAQWLR